jgi:hypothetical protein
MPENTLATLRDTIRTLRALHKDLKAERRQLVQVVADGVEIEMVAARVGFAIRQLQDARDLYSRLIAPAEPTHDAALTEIKLGMNPYGNSLPVAVEVEDE